MNDNQSVTAWDEAIAHLPPQTNPSHRILVVEDDGDIRRLNAEVLTRSGYRVDTVDDGGAAWDALTADCYDLMITDNNMPTLSGVELLKKLRAARMALPVIMATGKLPYEEFTRYPWLQPAAMLQKPYTIAELLGAVREVLHATDDEVARTQFAPPPNKQSQPSAEGWRT